MRRSSVPLLLLAALTFFVGLGQGAITDSDEAFYAEASREMVESGDWLTPAYNYEPRFQKPVLYYWVTAATFLATGPAEFPARVWAALAGVGLVLVTAACGRRWYDEETGLLAGAIAATTFGYVSMARMALPDLPLTFFVTLAIWAAFVATLEQERRPRGWVLLAAAAVGLGLLTKGPLGLLLPALVVVPVVFIERRSLGFGAGDLVLGVLLALGIAVPWYAAMWAQHGSPYFEGFFVGDNYERFATDRFNDPRPWWFYLPVIAGGLLPWTPLLLTWVGPISRFLRRRIDVATIELRLLLWALLPLIFFTLSVGKQPRYVLPVLPPLAILLAASILEQTREWRSLDGARVVPRRALPVAIGCLLSGTLLVTLAALLYRARPLLVNVGEAYSLGAAILIGVSGAAVMIVSLTSAWRAAPATLVLAAAISLPALQVGALSSGGADTVQQMARLVRQHRVGGEAVGTHRVFVRNLIFYTGVRQVDLVTPEQLANFLGQPDRVLVVVPADALAEAERTHGFTARRLASLPYFDEAGIRLRTLLWPNPEEDVQQVLLISNR